MQVGYEVKKGLLFIIIIFVRGCDTGNSTFPGIGIPFHKECQTELENIKKVDQRTYPYSYKKVFAASVNMLHDMGVDIYLKDYDKGMLLATGFKRFSAPSTNFGLYFQTISEQETKVSLKIGGYSYIDIDQQISPTANAVFDKLENEIQIEKNLTEKQIDNH